MAAPDAPVVEPEVEEHEARPLATYSDHDTEEWAKHQRGGRGGGSVGSSDSDVEVYWGPSARVVQWTQARTQQWALLAVGVPELEAAKVDLDGAALVCFPLDPTTKLEERLLAARVEEGATRAIAAAYQAQQWTICTEVRAAFPLPPVPYARSLSDTRAGVFHVPHSWRRWCVSGARSTYTGGQPTCLGFATRTHSCWARGAVSSSPTLMRRTCPTGCRPQQQRGWRTCLRPRTGA